MSASQKSSHLLGNENNKNGSRRAEFFRLYCPHLKGMKNAKVKDDIENYLKCN